ncbi:MAG: TSUP family transporter [Pseudomonadota bacterium]|nr:TSUP family transporter [Pseudomonadota bacterium]
MLYALIISSALATSVLSGLVGMAGGVVLMAILINVLPVSSAMVLHGVTQFTANGSRTLILRRFLLWQLLPGYMLGAALAVAGFSALLFVPDASVVLILVGLFPWVAKLKPKLSGLNITRPLSSVLCGLSVTSAQLLAGAAGPLLDMFYLNSGLDRQTVVANKAMTQTIGHLLRILYYGAIISVETLLPNWLFLAAAVTAVLGTRIGTWLLSRWNDAGFQHISGLIILCTGTICIIQGSYQLLRPLLV